MKLLTNSDIHNYYTRNNDKLKLPSVRRNWGEQRVLPINEELELFR